MSVDDRPSPESFRLRLSSDWLALLVAAALAAAVRTGLIGSVPW